MVQLMTLEQAYLVTDHDVIIIGALPSKEIPPITTTGLQYGLEVSAAYIRQLTRVYGHEPEHCRLFILLTPHHAQPTYQAAVLYNRYNDVAVNYAATVALGDLYWDTISRSALQQFFSPRQNAQ